MANLLRYSGLNLPVFDADEPLVTRCHGIDPGTLGDRFLRLTTLLAPGYTKLQKVLTDADEVFDEVAGKCGAVVIAHTWGLYPKVALKMNQSSGFSSVHLPDQYILAAEVETVKNCRDPSAMNRQLINNAPKYITNRNGDEVEWIDKGDRQFGVGKTVTDPNEKLRLLDIEPWILARRNKKYI